MIIILIYLSIIGFCIGSFLNVVIDRPFLKKSVINGRSECDFCHHPLRMVDLVPVISFLYLRARCRYCRRKLSWQYPLIEIVTSAMLVGLFLLLHPFLTPLSLLRYLLKAIVFMDLLILAVTDIKYGLLPNRYIFLGISTQIVLLGLFTPLLFPVAIITALGSMAFLLLIVVVTKGRGMGMGDVKYAFLLGLLVGFPAVIPAFYVAFLTGALVAIILIVLGKKKFHGGSIPFGPFLIIGTIAGYLWGIPLWQQLLKILGL